jgi:ABC-type lipoprotein release transport system permease subunit
MDAPTNDLKYGLAVPVAYLAALPLLLPIAAACLIPARRAARIAPAAILRGN